MSGERDPLTANTTQSYGTAEQDNSSRNEQTVAGQASGNQHEEHGDAVADHFVASKSLYGILFVMVFETMLVNADSSFILASAGQISSEFNQFEKAGWILLLYTLASGSAQPLYGKLSHIYGRKRLLLFSYIAFPVGSLIAGVSNSIWRVFVGRIIAGIGGGGAQSVATMILNDLLPTHELGIWRGYLNIGATIGRGLGGLVGGWIADSLGWRWTFLFEVPIAMISVFMALFNGVLQHLHESHNKSSNDSSSRFGRIDFIGAFTLVCSIVIFILLLNFGGTMFPWYSWNSAYFLLGGVVFTGIFVYVELKVAKEPIFPLELFRYKNVWLSYIIIACQVGAQSGMMYTVPLYFQITARDSASIGGAHLIPAVIGNTCGSILAGRYIRLNGRYKLWCVLAGSIASITYSVLILRWKGNTNIWESLEIFPGGLGTGIALTSTFVVISHALSPKETPMAIGGLFLSISLGSVGSVASVSSIIQQSLSSILPRVISTPDADEVIKRSMSDVNYVKNLTGTLRETVVSAYVVSLGRTYIFSLILSIGTFAAAVAVRQKKIAIPSRRPNST